MEEQHPLQHFQFEKVLSNDNENCKSVILGNIVNETKQPTIVILKKTSWDESKIACLHQSPLSFDIKSQNGKWANVSYTFNDSATLNIISPADSEDLIKYTASEKVVVTETAEDYRKFTLPFIEESIRTNKPDITWIQRILSGEKEQDRVLFNDKDPETGFIVVKGFRWSTDNLAELSCLIIVRNNEVRTLRDLRSQHLPLLEKIQQTVYKTIKENFNLPQNKLRLFVHYQPTFYQFHIHVSSVSYPAGYEAARSHLLDDIISNLKLFPDYYQLSTIVYELSETSLLLSAWKP